MFEMGTDIKELSRERPLRTPELFKLNDSYGHAHILKKYCGINPEYQIKATIEHRAMLLDHVWMGEISSILPAHLTFSEYRFPIIKQRTNKAVFAIGPSIHYANSLFSLEEIEAIKKAMGRTLLVFLPHSSMSFYVNFDHYKVISKIKEVEKDFDNILICLGWRDVLRDMEKPFLSEGYTCVTAGNVFDFNFLPRLKSLILISSHTMSFGFGTHIGFCIYLNRPHWVFPIPSTVDDPNNIKKITVDKESSLSKKQGTYFLSHFKEPLDDITEKQKELVDMMWGISSIKTSEELRDIFDMAEDMFNNIYLPANKQYPIMICQIIDHIQKGDVNKAEKLFYYAKRYGYNSYWERYLKGLIFAKKGDVDGAKKVVNFFENRKEIFRRLSRGIEEIISGKKDVDILSSLCSIYPRPFFYSQKKIDIPWRNV